MTNEEKAKDLIRNAFENAHDLQHVVVYNVKEICEDLIIRMAKWKDKQFAEEKENLRSLVDMLPMNENNQTNIEDLKDELKTKINFK